MQFKATIKNNETITDTLLETGTLVFLLHITFEIVSLSLIRHVILKNIVSTCCYLLWHNKLKFNVFQKRKGRMAY